MCSHTPIGSSLYAHSHSTGERREAEGYTDGSHDFTYKSAGMQLKTGADREQNEELLAGGGTALRSGSIFRYSLRETPAVCTRSILHTHSKTLAELYCAFFVHSRNVSV